MVTSTELLPKRLDIDRPLIAYAFLAQTTQVPGDLMSGLAPIFRSIAKQHVGKKFSAAEFAKNVSALYGIKIHPWAVDDLAPRLEKAGLLIKEQTSSSTSEYRYGEIEGEFSDVSENEIRRVVERFIEFSRPILENVDIPVDEKLLEDGFFDELVKIDFHSILLKPDRTDESTKRSTTLTLKKSPEKEQQLANLSAQSHLDVLCAAFIIETYRNDRPLYDLLVRIATGALVAQVVLNVQDPGKTVSLLTLRVALDAPFLMSLLDLAGEDSTEYANQLKKQLVDNKATLEVFRHSVDEVRDNLKAVLGAVSQGVGFGATARRLRNPTFSAYLTGVLHNIEGAISRVGIRIVDPPKNAGAFQYFTDDERVEFYNSLGHFLNSLAQDRDADSIAAVMRIRNGHRARMSQFHQSRCIFVTENERLAESASRFTEKKNMTSSSEVPPAITDRYLAGLIWILYGGKAEELTRYRLLASCAAALEVRNDVMGKMHGFLAQVDERKAVQFRAMMTVERAGQHLMQLTLGDSGLVRSTDDAEKILEQIELNFAEKYRVAQEEKVKEVEQAYTQVILEKDAILTQTSEALALSKEKIFASESEFDSRLSHALSQTAIELAQAQSTARLMTEQYEREQQQRLSYVGKNLEKAVSAAIKAESVQANKLGIAVSVWTFLAVICGMELLTSFSQIWGFLGAIISAALAYATFGKNPQKYFGGTISKSKDDAFNAVVKQYDLEKDLYNFNIDWSTGAVSLLAPKPHIIEFTRQRDQKSEPS